MKRYNFDVTRNGVTVRVTVTALSFKEAEEQVKIFLNEKTSTFEYVGSFTVES